MLKNCVFKPDVDTIEWCKKAGIRAVKTMAQTAVAGITVNSALNQTDWKLILSTAIVAGVVSVLTSIAGIPEVRGDE